MEKQSKYIREMEEEKEGVHTHNEELLQKVDEMERQLTKATSSRDNLGTKNQQLTEALEGRVEYMSDPFTTCTTSGWWQHHILCCILT